ncbi:MAG: hypothetical protein A3C06_00130 [Candidatus Taylorbacteria bacterium RIFCSPHIGHO2_02_FULL_46_13]|uniref:Type II secretion system protein GspF domain-containing protein n=1 Tax=Candidatus Taylorbacteria bacterium RIFCSPHIGHO2_02_FULL_46_13 TaxID=1802312 RepID=A0A1G2MTY4_9BACT|nr:MAG: hypothetical protein A3C06_00130 [Candidatus Taylorbacteria bacterium RIFCSPHIGHO2_02_FULL_46_13]
MPIFKFKAEKTSGEQYEAERTATDKFVLYQEIKREGDTVLYAEEVKAKKGFQIPGLGRLFSRVGMKEKIMFAHNLGAMLEAGLALSRALSVIERQTEKKGFKEVVQKISAGINRGITLSEAIKDFPAVFPPLFVSMVKAGEESGSLPKTLKSISTQMMNTYLLQKKIRGAMIYPAIIICVIIGISILMLTYVVPTMTSVFSSLNVELPWNTKLIIYASSAVTNHTILVVTLLVGAAVLLYFSWQTPRGKRFIDAVILRLPVIKGIAQEANSARTGRTLSSLLSSGVEVLQALEITADVVQNSYFKEVLLGAIERVKKGESLSMVFSEHTKFYPAFVGEMVSIGEETGKLAEMLGNVADYYEEEVSQKTKDLSVIIEPVLMIVIGCAVGFFALSMLAPMYSLVNVI